MINKSILTTISIGLIASFMTSCFDEKDDTSIVLSKNSIELFAGAKDTVAILSDYNEYVVVTDNEAVAFASIEGKNIIIFTSEMGNTILTIKDKLNNSSEINVSATGPRFGEWREYFPIDVEFIFVQSENEDVTEQIKSELMTKAENRVGAMYHFGNSDFHYQSKDGSVNKAGSYTVKDLILKLSYGDRNESYEILSSATTMVLKRDITADYTEQYPNGELTEVVEFRRLKYISY